MEANFDPYLQWLGIREPQRPPNHYRLLGLELFENDASVIAMAADRQMAHLRNFKVGPEADLAQQLLNELSAARICLLKPERKTAYDAQLRAAQKLSAAKQLPPAVAPVIITEGVNTKFAKPAAKATWKPWVALASLALLGVGLTILLINKNTPSNEGSVATTESGNSVKQPDPISKPPQFPAFKQIDDTPVVSQSAKNTQKKSRDPTNTKQNTTQKALPLESGKSTAETASTVANDGPDQPNPVQTPAFHNIDPRLLLGENVEIPTSEKSGVSGDPQQPQVAPGTLVAAVNPPRFAVPDKAIINTKEKEIREIFAEEYKSQKPEVKTALAAKLRQSANDSKDDSAMRYVLLCEARTDAILGGAVKLAVEINNELIRDYEVSDGDEQFALFSKMLASGNLPAAYYQLVMNELRAALSMLQAGDDYDTALKLVNMAMGAARHQRDAGTLTEMTQRTKELNLQRQFFQRAKGAKDSLAKNPEDPAANELWGSYLSFTKGEFAAGLPFLARGNSAELADLAKRELAEKKSPAEELTLADDWWTYGEKQQTQDAVRSVNARQQAGEKYVSLFPNLTGIDKAKAEKRINELKKFSALKSKREIDRMLARLFSTKWQVDPVAGGPPEFMIFRPDGTMTNRVFSSWVIENNELVLKGSTMTGKIKFEYLTFDVDYYQNGRIDYQGRAKPVN